MLEEEFGSIDVQQEIDKMKKELMRVIGLVSEKEVRLGTLDLVLHMC